MLTINDLIDCLTADRQIQSKIRQFANLTQQINEANRKALKALQADKPQLGTQAYSCLSYHAAPELIPGMHDQIPLDEIKALEWIVLPEPDCTGACVLTWRPAPRKHAG